MTPSEIDMLLLRAKLLMSELETYDQLLWRRRSKARTIADQCVYTSRRENVRRLIAELHLLRHHTPEELQAVRDHMGTNAKKEKPGDTK